MRSLRKALVARMVPDNAASLAALIELRFPLPLLIAKLQHPTPDLFGTPAVAGRNQLLITTLATAVRNIGRFQGDDPTKWTWGKLHAVTFRHPLDGTTPDAAAVMDLGPVDRPGDGTTVNATGFAAPLNQPRKGAPGYLKDFEQTSGASYREIFDFSDWDKSLAVNTPGQSGQPTSPHYSDLLPLWDQGQYFPLLFSRDAVEKSAVNKLTLTP
jgi:penicillin amidase